MLIAHQKFRSRMIGHYNRSCHVITHNTNEVRGLIYSHSMRTLPTSCHVVLHCSDVMLTSHSTCMQASRPPYVYAAHQELLMDVPFAEAKPYLSKTTASHFGTLNMKFANQNVLEGFSLPCTMRTRLIAMKTSGYV